MREARMECRLSPPNGSLEPELPPWALALGSPGSRALRLQRHCFGIGFECHGPGSLHSEADAGDVSLTGRGYVSTTSGVLRYGGSMMRGCFHWLRSDSRTETGGGSVRVEFSRYTWRFFSSLRCVNWCRCFYRSRSRCGRVGRRRRCQRWLTRRYGLCASVA